jgi:hypothetical protein
MSITELKAAFRQMMNWWRDVPPPRKETDFSQVTFEQVVDWINGINLPPFEERATTSEILSYLVSEVEYLREIAAAKEDDRPRLEDINGI